MRPITQSEAPQANIAPDAVIVGDDVDIGAGAVIESGVSIRCKRIRIGSGARVERGTTIRALGDTMEHFELGDEAFIGFENQILAPEFVMRDYSQLHNSGLHSGYRPLSIGYNCWIGQSSILNCTQDLTLGNNVRIGTQSQLWTHVASGELLEGCTLFGENPLVLEDNVWIVGGAVISPGLHLARNSIVMTGSVLTKSTEAYHTYAGVPAKDVTDKLSFWKPLSDDEKWEMLLGFVEEFRSSNAAAGASLVTTSRYPDPALRAETGDVVIAREVTDWAAAEAAGLSLFDLSTKTYLKQRAPAEVAWVRFTNGYRARFIPRHA